MQCLWDIDRWQMETQLHSFFLALIFQLYTQKLKVLIVAAQPKKMGFDCILFELWQLKGQRSQNTLHFGITKWVKHQLSWIILQCKIVFFVDQFTPCSVNWWHPSPDPCCHPNCLKKLPENELTWHENQKNYKDKWKEESMNMRKYGHFLFQDDITLHVAWYISCLKCFVIGTNTVCHYAQVHLHLQTSVSERNSLLSLVGHHYSILIIGLLKKYTSSKRQQYHCEDPECWHQMY